MRYRDLVQFEPIETVIQLRHADDERAARRLVQTYVISSRMADQLTNVVLPQLQLQTARDSKGVLIIGAYGSGKSHLLSALSAVAEYPDLAGALAHPQVRQAAQAIAGRFKVARVEIGGVTGSLRDILLRELGAALARWGTPFRFPPADQVTNNKDALVQAMAAFQQTYPEHGLLLVVDELLDYLRTRPGHALILDLAFLRELGEAAALTAFRFLGGLQETLFDNPRFQHVAGQLRRVRDRFEQVRIAREDIAYVVSHRLLSKTDAQRARITEHLRQFAPLYGGMAERLDEFARLFHIHPAYIETLERLALAEKREALKTFSLTIRRLLDQEVPSGEPGLVSYDHYWDVLRESPAMRGLPEVAEVIDKSSTLEARVRSAYTRPHLRPMALRLIHALSVQRLTTSDIDAPQGVTAEALRDGLCLHARMPEPSAEFLLSQVQVALREIKRTVSGQYLSFNEANGQYYLDVKKDVDFDARIKERGELIDQCQLNRFFFDALRQLLNLSEATCVAGHPIWTYELPWPERNVTRPGYVFFGAPDERPTSLPPRDFSLYVLPPFLTHEWRDDRRPGEVIFRFAGVAPDFEAVVRIYGGARALAGETATHRDVYRQKAGEAARQLLRWLREHAAGHLTVIYQGVERSISAVHPPAGGHDSEDLAAVAQGVAAWPERAMLPEGLAQDDVAAVLQRIAACLLAPHFAQRYPDYPAFRRLPKPMAEDARASSAAAAIRYLAGGRRANPAIAVLEALELLDDEGNLRPERSRYGRRYLELLHRKHDGQVVNRDELIDQVAGRATGTQPIERDVFFGLEPEWVAVILVALVARGEIVLNLRGQEMLDAGTIDRAATMPVAVLAGFRCYARPRPAAEAVTLQAGSLLAALQDGGLPCTVPELERRFSDFLRRAMQGHDPARTRVTLAGS